MKCPIVDMYQKRFDMLCEEVGNNPFTPQQQKQLQQDAIELDHYVVLCPASIEHKAHAIHLIDDMQSIETPEFEDHYLVDSYLEFADETLYSDQDRAKFENYEQEYQEFNK